MKEQEKEEASVTTPCRNIDRNSHIDADGAPVGKLPAL
jgi:hypothetical protein